MWKNCAVTELFWCYLRQQKSTSNTSGKFSAKNFFGEISDGKKSFRRKIRSANFLSAKIPFWVQRHSHAVSRTKFVGACTMPVLNLFVGLLPTLVLPVQPVGVIGKNRMNPNKKNPVKSHAIVCWKNSFIIFFSRLYKKVSVCLDLRVVW